MVRYVLEAGQNEQWLSAEGRNGFVHQRMRLDETQSLVGQEA